MLSYVREISYKNEIFAGFTLDELTDWFLDNVDETNYNKFIEQMIDILPYISFEIDVKCINCKHESRYEFTQLPDFSLVIP